MTSNASDQIKVGDWFAVGQIFMGPYCFDDPKSGTPSAVEFGVNMGVQALAAMDAVSQSPLHGRPFEKTPSPFTALEIMAFLHEVFERHGLPRIGVLISSSVWKSSHEMLLDDTISQRAAMLADFEIEIGPMDVTEKEKITLSLKQIGLKTEFDDDNLCW